MKTFQSTHLFRWEYKSCTVGQSKRGSLESRTYTSRCWEMKKTERRRREKRPASVWMRPPLLPKTEEKTSLLQRSTDRMNKQVLPTCAVLTCGRRRCRRRRRRRRSCAADGGGNRGSCSWRGGGWGPAPRKTYTQFVQLWLRLQTDPRLHQCVIFIRLQVVEVGPQEILNFTDCQVLGEQQRRASGRMNMWLQKKEKLLIGPQTLTRTTFFSRLVKVDMSMLMLDVDKLRIKVKFAPAAHQKKYSKIGLTMRLCDQRLQLWGVFAYVDKASGVGNWWKRLW